MNTILHVHGGHACDYGCRVNWLAYRRIRKIAALPKLGQSGTTRRSIYDGRSTHALVRARTPIDINRGSGAPQPTVLSTQQQNIATLSVSQAAACPCPTSVQKVKNSRSVSDSSTESVRFVTGGRHPSGA